MKIIRKVIAFALIIAITMSAAVLSFGLDNKTEVPPGIDATSAILIDADTGDILYEKNAYEKRDPASITKILNCLVVLDTLDMNQEVTIDYDPETEGSVMHLQKGEKLKVEDLVYGMMLWSANDAAEALAKASAGDIETFCGMMNDKAAACGAENTFYTNPNGLNPPGKVNNVTTAHDIAVIAAFAMKDPDFAKIVGTDYLKIPATNKYEERKHKSSNRCEWDTRTKVEIDGEQIPLKYDGCKGVKTGYSSTAEDCFCGYASRGKTNLIAVVLNASHEIPKFEDTIKLWNYGFANFKNYCAAKPGDVIGQQPVARGSLREVDLGVRDRLSMTVAKKYNAGENVSIKLELDEKKVNAPISKGQVLGEAIAVDKNGRELAKQELISLENAERGGILSNIGIADEDAPLFLIAFAALIIILLLLVFVQKKRMNKKNNV